MSYQGNGSEAVSGVYERERLRRRARKLGLRLVKSDRPCSDELTHTSHASGKHSDVPRDSANAAKSLNTEFDKCG